MYLSDYQKSHLNDIGLKLCRIGTHLGSYFVSGIINDKEVVVHDKNLYFFYIGILKQSSLPNSYALSTQYTADSIAVVASPFVFISKGQNKYTNFIDFYKQCNCMPFCPTQDYFMDYDTNKKIMCPNFYKGFHFITSNTIQNDEGIFLIQPKEYEYLGIKFKTKEDLDVYTFTTTVS